MANPSQRRDSHGRFKPDHRARNAAIGVTAAVGLVAAGVAAVLRLGLFDRFFSTGGEHAAPDLALDAPRPGPANPERAPDAFRPDPTAPVPRSEREGLRPATGPAPAFAADRGDLRSEPA